MRELLRYRAMAAVCRKKMALYPADRGKWEIEALQWDCRALDLISYRFKGRKPNRSNSPSGAKASPSADDLRVETIVETF
jgi:hypothetical protein